jgi:hypothetical protein
MEKEMFAIITAFKTWRHYLQSRKPVKILSDHMNLTRWITLDITASQRMIRWAETLSYYNFTIEHLAGAKNVAADGLSRRSDHLDVVKFEKEGDEYKHTYLLRPEHFLPFTPEDFKRIATIKIKPDNYIIKKISELLKADKIAQTALKLQPNKQWKKLKVSNSIEVLTFEGLIYVPNNREIKRLILQSRHDANFAGHFGRRKTLDLVRRDFYWPGMTSYIIEYIKTCDVCQRNRIDTHKPYGKLQPLPIPDAPWSHIGYDMVGPLPESKGYNAIMTIVDRLTKMAHFIPCRTDLDTQGCVDLFMKEIWRLHGTPIEVISDRGRIFNSKFMHGIYNALGIQYKYSTAYHPQTDGQAERTNQIAEQVLRKIVNDEQDNWSSLLPMVEFAYNRAEQESIHMSPFDANIGHNPRWQPRADYVHKVPAAKVRMKIILRNVEIAKQAMKEAQLRQRQHYDKKRKEAPTFKPGDLVLVNQKNFKTVTDSKKLDHRKAGPFVILKRVGRNAYKLKFSKRLKGLSPVINVNLLELYHPDTIEGRTQPPPPPVVISKDHIEFEIQKITRHRRFGANKTVQYLVRWVGHSPAEDEWLTATALKNSPKVLHAYWDKHPELKPKTQTKNKTKAKTKTKPRAKGKPKPTIKRGEGVTAQATSEEGVSLKEGDGVMVEDLGLHEQYKKTYEGPSLIRPNASKTHRMATRSNKRTPP